METGAVRRIIGEGGRRKGPGGGGGVTHPVSLQDGVINKRFKTFRCVFFQILETF